MDRKDDNVLKAVAHFLEEVEGSGIRLVSAYLYGSHAEGRARPDSDIDVALIAEDFTGDLLEDHRKIVDALLRSDPGLSRCASDPSSSATSTPWPGRLRPRG